MEFCYPVLPSHLVSSCLWEYSVTDLNDAADEPQLSLATDEQDEFQNQPKHHTISELQNLKNSLANSRANALQLVLLTLPINETTAKLFKCQTVLLLYHDSSKQQLVLAGARFTQDLNITIMLVRIMVSNSDFEVRNVTCDDLLSYKLTPAQRSLFSSTNGIGAPSTKLAFCTAKQETRKIHIALAKANKNFLLLEFPYMIDAQSNRLKLLPTPGTWESDFLAASSNIQVNLSSELLINTVEKVQVFKTAKHHSDFTNAGSLEIKTDRVSLEKLMKPVAEEDEDSEDKCSRPTTPEPIEHIGVRNVDSDILESLFFPNTLVTATELLSGHLVLRTTSLSSTFGKSAEPPASSAVSVPPLGANEYLLMLRVLAKAQLLVRVLYSEPKGLFTIEYYALEFGFETPDCSITLHTRLFRRNYNYIPTSRISDLVCLLFQSSGIGDTYTIMISKPELRDPLIIHFNWDHLNQQLSLEDVCYDLVGAECPDGPKMGLFGHGSPSVSKLLNQIHKARINPQILDKKVAVGLSTNDNKTSIVLVGKGLYKLLYP